MRRPGPFRPDRMSKRLGLHERIRGALGAAGRLAASAPPARPSAVLRLVALTGPCPHLDVAADSWAAAWLLVAASMAPGAVVATFQPAAAAPRPAADAEGGGR